MPKTALFSGKISIISCGTLAQSIQCFPLLSNLSSYCLHSEMRLYLLNKTSTSNRHTLCPITFSFSLPSIRQESTHCLYSFLNPSELGIPHSRCNSCNRARVSIDVHIA